MEREGRSLGCRSPPQLIDCPRGAKAALILLVPCSKQTGSLLHLIFSLIPL